MTKHCPSMYKCQVKPKTWWLWQIQAQFIRERIAEMFFLLFKVCMWHSQTEWKDNISRRILILNTNNSYWEKHEKRGKSQECPKTGVWAVAPKGVVCKLDKAAKTYRIHLSVFGFCRRCKIYSLFYVCFDICCNNTEIKKAVCWSRSDANLTFSLLYSISLFYPSFQFCMCALYCIHILYTCAFVASV